MKPRLSDHVRRSFIVLSRYVALNTLNKVVSIDTNAVQRHRNIILDCLRDSDISIRRRALELSYALINESNVRILIRELLAFLEVADNEFKLGMTTQISIAAERFAPNKRWHIDTVLRVLKLVGPLIRFTPPGLIPTAGGKLCPRRDSICFHPPRSTHTGTPGIYRFKTLHSSEIRHLARVPDSRRYLDHRRIQRSSTTGWFSGRGYPEAGKSKLLSYVSG